MPVGLLLVAAMATAAWALWARRTSFGCQGEVAPSLLVITAITSAYLTSTHASTWVGGVLHAVTQRWNYEDPLGHLSAILCVCIAIYMCLVRLADQEAVQHFYTQWVVRPVTAALAVMQAAWMMSPASERPRQHFEDLDGGLWLMTYWGFLCGILLYLLAVACRILLRLRALENTLVLNMYLLTVGLTIVSVLAMGFHVMPGLYIRDIAWLLGYASVVCWSVTPAYSWMMKSKPVGVPDVIPHVDSGADRATGFPPSAAGDSDDS